jgi:hypothetical protein
VDFCPYSLQTSEGPLLIAMLEMMKSCQSQCNHGNHDAPFPPTTCMSHHNTALPTCGLRWLPVWAWTLVFSGAHNPKFLRRVYLALWCRVWQSPREAHEVLEPNGHACIWSQMGSRRTGAREATAVMQWCPCATTKWSAGPCKPYLQARGEAPFLS